MSDGLFNFSKLKVYNKLFLRIFAFGLLITISQLRTPKSQLIYAQDDYLEMKGNTKVDTLTFGGDRTAEPSAPVRGEIFYNSTAKHLHYHNGTGWQEFGGTDRVVATKIVAAYNSLDTSRADYVCDGTNDQVEINQAITALGTTGGVVYLLEGTYNISASINLDTTAPNDSNKAIIGTGAGTVLKLFAGSSNVNVINASNVNRILISQLRIDGNKVGGGSNCKGIYFSSVANSKIDRVWVENMNFIGIELFNSSNNIISGNHIQSNGNGGIFVNGSSFSNPANYSHNNIISGNNIQSNDSSGIALAVCSNNTISGNVVQSSKTVGGISLSSSSSNSVSGNTVWSNTGDGISWSTSSNNSVSGNTVWSNTGNGIVWSNSSNNTISGNNVYSNLQNGIFWSNSSNNNISGNVIYNNGGTSNYDGIRITSSSGGNLVASNFLYDSGTGTGYPINIDTTSGGYLVGNQINWSLDCANCKRINDLSYNTYTDKIKMSLSCQQINTTAASLTLDVATSPCSCMRIGPIVSPTTVTLADGKSPGDLLILQNSASSAKNLVIIFGGSSITLGPYDILRLIWNGTRWLKMAYTDINL